MKHKLLSLAQLIILLLVLTGNSVLAQGTTQYVCTGTHDYHVTSTLTGSSFNWTIAPGTAGVDWSITGQGTASVTVNWITPNTDPGYTLSVVETGSSANGNCVGATKSITVFVNPPASVNQPSNQIYCNGSTTSVVTFSGTATSYNWSNNNTSIGLAVGGTGNLPSFTATNTGSAPVVATITVFPLNSNGGTTCNGSPVTFTITINPSPIATATPSSESICSGAQTDISLTSAVAGTTFSWTYAVNPSGAVTGASATSGTEIEQTLTNSTDAPATVTYTVTPSAATCAGSPITVVETVNPIPGTSGIILSAPSNKLQNLTVSAGTLSPVFSGTTYSYSSSVNYSNSSVTVTPTSVEANAQITVNGIMTASGTASLPVMLNVGSNSITISVTSCTGSTQAYTLNINRNGSGNLTSLTTSPTSVILSPAFQSGTISYTATASYDVSSMTLTPVAEESGATIMVNGVQVTSGAASQPVNLAIGVNSISVIVTGTGGVSQTYTITVTRDGNNYLQNLIVKRGPTTVPLNPGFNRSTLGYTASCTGTPVSVTPTAEDGSATITVNGTQVTSGQAASVPVSLGSNTITIIVTPGTGNRQRTYTVNVTRTS